MSLVSKAIHLCRWRQKLPPKHAYLSTKLHNVTSQKTVTYVLITLRTTDNTIL
jgi:hypothetical protein